MTNLYLGDGKSQLINIAEKEHDHLHPFKAEVYNGSSDERQSDASVMVKQNKAESGLTASLSNDKILREQRVRSELSVNVWAVSELNHHEYKIKIYFNKGQLYVEADDLGMRKYLSTE